MAQYSVLRPSQGDLQPWEAQKSSQAQLSSLPPSRFMVLRFRLIIFSAEFLRMLGTDQQLDSPINSLRWEITWGHMKISSGGKLFDTIWRSFEVENYSTFPLYSFFHMISPQYFVLIDGRLWLWIVIIFIFQFFHCSFDFGRNGKRNKLRADSPDILRRRFLYFSSFNSCSNIPLLALVAKNVQTPSNVAPD